jgi:hypothetical protein
MTLLSDMTNLEMKPLLEHREEQVRKLAEHYGDLFDAAMDFCTVINSEDWDREIECTPTGDAFYKLQKVLAEQPNEEKKP